MKKILTTKNCLKKFFLMALVFKKYETSYVLLKNLVTSKITTNTANDDQRDFIFHLMKGYNIGSFFTKKKKLKI